MMTLELFLKVDIGSLVTLITPRPYFKVLSYHLGKGFGLLAQLFSFSIVFITI